MRKRLQVLLDEPEYRRLVRIARARSMSVSEWVRYTLREAAREEPTTDRSRKIAVIRAAAGCSFPSGELGDMLADIERGPALGVDSE